MTAAAASARRPPRALWWLLARREWQHHPWRHAWVLIAVALGVALAFSVQVINDSALAEFGAAVRAVNGDPDLSLRGRSGSLDERLLDRLAHDEAVQTAHPVVEADTLARAGERSATVRVLGIDVLEVASFAPQLLPLPAAGEPRLAALDGSRAFANAAARERLAIAPPDTFTLQTGAGQAPLRLAGQIAAGGGPLLVLDVAAAQALFGLTGRLSRIDVRLAPGWTPERWARERRWPDDVLRVEPSAAEQRLSTLSRAYRVNLTVLALVALLVGGFMVFSVVSLSVAQRSAGFALLGVLGLAARGRRLLVLAECAALGLVGSGLGLLLGGALAWLGLRVLGGDLGGGFFPAVQPALRLSPAVAAGCALLGVLATVAGGWLPARQAQALHPAQALKGLGSEGPRPAPAWHAALLLALGLAMAFVPPFGGVPLAAYASVAALLLGGVALVPALVAWLLLERARPSTRPLVLLARRRARHQRATASATVAGVVASLALAVALTVMVQSFRTSVSAWLDQVLPADLYGRSAVSSSAAEHAWFDDALVGRIARLPGIRQVDATRVRALSLDPRQPVVSLIARPLAEPTRTLPLQGPVAPAPAGVVGAWVSEAVVALYGARVGQRLELPLEGSAPLPVVVRGVWRDYARSFGAVAVDLVDYRAHTGDHRLNELAIRLAPGADEATVLAAVRAALPTPDLLRFTSTEELRTTSLRIFDRSFAVTYYLQAMAIGIGLVGIAASLSAQVIARRKEFGLLAHLGFTRPEVMLLVAGETAVWLLAGVLVGLGIGLAVSAVLVFVVNPQSFLWTMDWNVPVARLAVLAAAVLATGLGTALFAARRARSRSAVLAVKEDW